MQSLENRALSPTKRLGVSLNVDTGYKTKPMPDSDSDSDSPIDSIEMTTRDHHELADHRGLRLRPNPRETFLDDVTPVDPGYLRAERDMDRNNRDSHDLSLNPRQITRDSLVEGMLLSLDQISFDQGHDDYRRPSAIDENPLYGSSYGDGEYPHTLPNNFPARGRSHGYSFSSDYNNDDSSQYSMSQTSRGRRSNSSSNFQTGLQRLNSLRKDSAASQPIMSKSASGPIPSSAALHARNGKGSKGSSSNSIDLGYAQVTGSQRWVHGLAGRSSSFDYGSDRYAAGHANTVPRQMGSSSPVFDPSDYDAAPTPNIPGGPRRFRPPSPILHSRPSQPEAQPPRLERKRSNKSSKSTYTKARPATQASNTRPNYGLNDPRAQLPPLPAFSKESAPAPHVAYGKPKAPADAPIPPPTKERPGFFRRVFGSNKLAASSPNPPASQGSTSSIDTSSRPNSKPGHIVNQMKPAMAQPPPPRDPPPPPSREAPPPTLSKKPSSFFRRRKKSVSTVDPVPRPVVPPIQLHPERRLDFREVTSSPVGSLFKAMDPYLKEPGNNSEESPFASSNIDRLMNDSPDLDRHVRGFSPDYEPDPNATIRTVGSVSHDESLQAEQSRSRSPSATPRKAPSRSPSGDRLRQDSTFLQDNSDTDRDPPDSTTKTSSQWQLVSKPSPSIARDGTLAVDAAPSSRRGSARGSAVELPASLPASSSKEDDFVIVTPSKVSKVLDKENRVWLEPSSSDDEAEDKDAHKSPIPVQAQPPASASARSGSTETGYKSASSLPLVQVEPEEPTKHDERPHLTLNDAIQSLGNGEPLPTIAAPTIESVPATAATSAPSRGDNEPEKFDRVNAQQIYEGSEQLVSKEMAAAWMGDPHPLRARVLTAYMDLFDFANLNILAALRALCNRLVLKGESQQVDRILTAFSTRWCQCNPNHGFKAIDVVHTICYSILLLNTDLHMADIEQKMTRSQFIKNTMPTVRRSAVEFAPNVFDSRRGSILPGKSSTFNTDTPNSPISPGTEGAAAPLKAGPDEAVSPNTGPEECAVVETLAEPEKSSWRASFRPPPRNNDGSGPTPLDFDTPVDDCGPLVKAPFNGTLRTWEVQVEIVLKDFYNSIRNERLPLFGAAPDRPQLQHPTSSSLSVFAGGMLRRTPSVLSKAPSEPQNYTRGRTADSTRATGKWGNKNRSRPRIYPGSSGLGSSRTSLEDSSIWSPSVSSSTWSKYSLGKTQGSMSVDSLGSQFQHGDYQQSIGFANALSQAIIREDGPAPGSAGIGSDELRGVSLLEDESLELAGAPWAKEGMVKHKHHLEYLDKKAKDRNWADIFVVVEKGSLSLFSFSSKSMRHKKSPNARGVVGGGNWQDNAENLGTFQLRQTIASALPSPGYSKARPHVWALSLPTGAVHLFQVGTPEIVKEFVSTANYWSARLSNHPLVGGISNIEYGWSDGIIDNALVAIVNEVPATRPSTSGARPSLQGSMRSSMDHAGGVKARLPGDRCVIYDWKPPTQSMRASNLLEPDQLNVLEAYVESIEAELTKHNQLRGPMLLAFTTRHVNAQKSMANWERKSSYLLREIVKFRTYIEALRGAEASKVRVNAERAAQKLVEEHADEDRDDQSRSADSDDDDDDNDITLRPE